MREENRKAEELLLNLGLAKEVPVPVEDICKKLGISLHECPSSTILGVIISIGEIRILQLKAGMSNSQRRFTIGHEIGHLILDHKGASASLKGGCKQEWEDAADTFARSLLMPEEEMIIATRELRESPGRLARRFQVPKREASIRIEEFTRVGP